METKKVIPLNLVRPDSLEDIDALEERLEGAGFLRLMQISEPRLSELVAKYKAKGYEVEIVPLLDEGDGTGPLPSGGGCGSGSCSSGGSASSPSGGCASGGCGSGAAPTSPVAGISPIARRAPRQVVPGVGTIYVRLQAKLGGA